MPERYDTSYRHVCFSGLKAAKRYLPSLYLAMSTRKRTETQCVVREVGPKRIKALELDTCSFIVQEATSPTFDPTMVLLRHLFLFNEGRSRYVSVGFYPVCNYAKRCDKAISTLATTTYFDHRRTECTGFPECTSENYSAF